MRPLRGELLLEAWEFCASSRPGPRRAIALLAAAAPHRAWDQWMDLSLAQRDLELFRLRQMTFGDSLQGSSPCAECGTRLEFEMSVEVLIRRLEALKPPQDIEIRPVNSRDLCEALDSADPRRYLLAASGADAMTVSQFDRVNEGAETRFTLACPQCKASATVDLDIAQFLWREVRHAALTILREVHELATAYGWSERTILEMSAARRATYLEMARA